MRYFIILMFWMIISPEIVLSQEVVVTGFPIGVGRSIDNDFFKPYNVELQKLADILKNNPLSGAIITGGADGTKYQIGDDTKNSALALGRAHTLRNYFTNEFHINPDQIIISSEEGTQKGPDNRFASIRISKDLQELAHLVSNQNAQKNNLPIDNILARIDALEQKPPVEKHFTETPATFQDKFGIKVSAGLSSSPFGSIPMVGGGVTWEKNIFIEGFVGHTFWKDNFSFNGLSIDTKKRLIGGQIIYFPSEKYRIGILGGWVRSEEIAQEYYEYVKMSEGPIIGLRYTIFNNLSLTAAFNPSKQRLISEEFSSSKNNQLMFNLSYFEILGGGK